jgi:hypothetical protein
MARSIMRKICLLDEYQDAFEDVYAHSSGAPHKGYRSEDQISSSDGRVLAQNA